MGQSDESPADTGAVDEEVGSDQTEDGESVLDRYFWSVLIASILLPTAAGVGVVYVQYDRIHKRVEASPYAEQIAQARESIPYLRSSDTSEDKRKYGSFAQIDGLVVNPANSGGERYLAVSVAFESKSTEVLDELRSKTVVIRDEILDRLSERTVGELSAPNRRDDLKRELREATNGILRKGTVDRLYFTEFVLQ